MMGLGLGKLGSVGRAISTAFNPAVLWPLGASSPGMWIDPPYTASLFSTSAGTTAISAIGTVLDTSNPVGLILDRKGELGPELVLNGDASNGTTGWLDGTWTGVFSVSSGVFNLVATNGYARVYQGFTTDVGKKYLASCVARKVSGSSPAGLQQSSLGGGTAGPEVSTTSATFVPLSFYFVASATTSYVTLCEVNGVAGGVFEFDNISVKEIPGIHLSQATSTSRPVASARKNELVGTAALATQNVTSKALQYVLSFWGTGSVTLSGTSTAGPLVGTGAGDRVSLTFTPTAGTLTLTVSGTVTNAQLEVVG